MRRDHAPRTASDTVSLFDTLTTSFAAIRLGLSKDDTCKLDINLQDL